MQKDLIAARIRMEKIFSFIRHMVFEEVGSRIRPGSLKNLMDLLFMVFEEIGYHFEILSSTYIEMYYEMVISEIKMADISPQDRVLVIGCGSIPSTSIIIALETDARIVALDNDPRAVARANRYVKKHGLDGKIMVQYGDGSGYPVEDFDVIFVSYGVKQQLRLLKYLSENIDRDTRIVFRIPEDDVIKEDFLSKLFLVKNVVKTRVFGPLCSCLMVKKED